MPTSHPRTLTSIHSLIRILGPQSLIDLGVGHGKTGVLAREYLDIMQERYLPDTWQTRIYGVEVFAGYRNPLWDYAYDLVVVAEALEGLKELPDVELVVALDVWEHFEPDYARHVLETCLKKARRLLISTPKSPLKQGSVCGNVAETHVSRWGPEDFVKAPHLMATCTSHDWIVLVSNEKIPYTIRSFSNPKLRVAEALQLAIALWRIRHCNR